MGDSSVLDIEIGQAINVVHQIPKSASWICRLVERIQRSATDPEAVVRHAGEIRALADEMSSAALLFLDDAVASVGGESVTTLAHVIGGAVREVNCSHPDRVVIVQIEAGDRVPVDRRIKDVLTHLLDNAINSDPNGATVLLEAAAVDSLVSIMVADQGDGMSPEVAEQCTELGFSTRTDGLGSGIGLNMVRRTVESLRGHLDIETALGRGTRVTVTLPIERARA